MIEFYNSTNGGVDTFNQMCSVMTCSRKTNRWPMCANVFYGMLNISCTYSYIIYCHNASMIGQKVMIRLDFMKKMYTQLVEPWLKIRLAIRTMTTTHVKIKMIDILGAKTDEDQGEGQVDGSGEGQSSSSNDLQSVEGPNVRKRKVCGLCSYTKGA